MTTPAVPIASSEPTSLAAGETVVWARDARDYASADGWALAYYLAGPSTLKVAGVPAAADAGVYTFTISAHEGGALKPGTYRWAVYAEKGSGATAVRVLVGRGTARVTPNITSAQAGELLSANERAWEAVKAALEGRLTDGLKSYTIGGRAVALMDVAELVKLEAMYRVRVWRERNPGRRGPAVVVNFGG